MCCFALVGELYFVFFDVSDVARFQLIDFEVQIASISPVFAGVFSYLLFDLPFDFVGEVSDGLFDFSVVACSGFLVAGGSFTISSPGL